MPHVVDSRRKDRPSHNYVFVYISQYNRPTMLRAVQRVFYRAMKSFFRDDGNERGEEGEKEKRERERKGYEKAEAEEKSGRESVDLLLKRPAGNNGRRATRTTDAVYKRGREIRSEESLFYSNITSVT